jgi:hypothetical protein
MRKQTPVEEASNSPKVIDVLLKVSVDLVLLNQIEAPTLASAEAIVYLAS